MSSTHLPSPPLEATDMSEDIKISHMKLDHAKEHLESMDTKTSSLKSKETTLKQKESSLKGMETGLKGMEGNLKDRESGLKGMEGSLKDREKGLKGMESGLTGMEGSLKDRESSLKGMESGIRDREKGLKGMESGLKGMESSLKDRESSLKYMESSITDKEGNLRDIESSLKDKESILRGMESTLKEKESDLSKYAAETADYLREHAKKLHANGGTTSGKSISSSSTYYSSSSTSSTSTSKKEKKPIDIISRGVYKSNPLGTATFIGLRALDPIIQFNLLSSSGWGEKILSKLNLNFIPIHAFDPTAADSPLHLPLPRLILLAMAAGSTAKQIYWLTGISREEFPPKSAVAVSGYNTLLNSLNSLLLLGVGTSSSLSSYRIRIPGTDHLTLALPTAVGTIIYILGMSIETISEVQRKRFKENKDNKGRVCNTGWWAKARHINYGGYTLWRMGYAMAAGGWIAGLGTAAWHAWHFVRHSSVAMNDYMSEKYGEQWEGYKKEVPWLLLPGIY